MTDFFELEKRCKKLKQKQLLKYSIYLILIFLLIIGVLFYIQNKPKPTPIKIEHKKPIQIKKIKEINKTKPKVKIKAKTEINKTIEPMLNVDIDLNKIDNISIAPNKKIKKEINKTKPKVEVKKPILQEETISFEKAIKLAEIYYNNADYKNSIKWCKIASKIDNTNEKVWKLYALNLEKTGQTDKAIKILKTYLQYKDSIELRYILKRLTQ